MRALAILFGFLGAVHGSYGAYAFIRAVGPSDRSNDYGYGNAATAPPGGGTLLQTRNFKAVVAALHRELGPEAKLMSLDVKWTEAGARAGETGALTPAAAPAPAPPRAGVGAADSPTLSALVPLSRTDPAAIDRLVASARKQNSAPVEEIRLE